jgi:putative endopeptidase
MQKKISILSWVGAGLSLSLIVGAVTGVAMGDSQAITKESLLKGCEIPDRRDFPVDPAVSPCTDLYQYACNKVVSSFKLRDDRSAHTFSFNDSYERILYAKKNFLKQLAESKDDASLTKHTRVLKNVYTACMDESASKDEEKKLVAEETKRISAIKDNQEFMDFVSNRIDQPWKGAISLDDEPNQDDPSRRDATLDSEFMSLPERSYYDNPEVLKDYLAVVTEFFKTNGLENAEARAKAVVDFEKDFAHHYPLPVEFRARSAERNPITRAELLKNYPNLKLDRILGRIPASTKFRNLEPETLAFLNDQLAHAPIGVLKDTLLYQSASGFMDDAYPEYFNKSFEFKRKNLGGPEKRPDRQERCTRMVMNNFGREMDEQMLPILFPNFPDDKVVHLAETVRASILEGLKHNTWLSPKGRAGAIKKLTKAELLLVKPQTEDEWDFTPAQDYSPKDRYDNSLKLRKALIEKEIREYGEKRNRRRWLMGPLTVNAYYMPMDNTFVLPAGILQYPFFDPSLPEKMNLAAAGSVIGHELGHSIDDKGSKYDETGRLHPWMSKKDLSEFEKRGGRFIDRFNKIGHNGTLTLGENIGDHVGVTFAFQAAFGRGFTAKTPEDLEAERAFFTQYARNWCQVVRPKYREMLLKTDPHAAGYARVNEQVMQQPGFQEGFACKAGDAMYLPPADRIRVW